MRLLCVVLGGGVGSGLRYGVNVLLTSREAPIPLATWTVNLVGSFAMSFLMALPFLAADRPPELRLLLTTGLLGGFTTYSAFNFELIARAERGAWGPLALYATLTLVGCLLAGGLGWGTGRALGATLR